jgi:cellulose synthase/poly-beta-1,6-N-acetylglucosamine synthase-like glycosyltransferase
MVRRWQEAHPAFSLTIAKETTPRAPAAHNHPLALVKTKWVQFLDVDDVLFQQTRYQIKEDLENSE